MKSPYFRRQIQASVPKLPNHLRTYYNVWARNKRARDASERAKKGVDALKALNETTKARQVLLVTFLGPCGGHVRRPSVQATQRAGAALAHFSPPMASARIRV